MRSSLKDRMVIALHMALNEIEQPGWGHERHLDTAKIIRRAIADATAGELGAGRIPEFLEAELRGIVHAPLE